MIKPKLVSKLEHHSFLAAHKSKQVVDPSGLELAACVAYAASVWPMHKLTGRPPEVEDADPIYQYGDRTLYHFPCDVQNHDSFLIVVVAKSRPIGHLILDYKAEYATPQLDVPQAKFSGEPVHGTFEAVIPSIDPCVENPYAVLVLHGGTYMQAYRTQDGFELEHQIVNNSCHYRVTETLTSDQVVAAMNSYSFGKLEWLRNLSWEEFNPWEAA